MSTENLKQNGIIILLFLAMLYISIDSASTVLVYKVIKIGFFIQPGGILVYPLLFLIADVVAEIYGYRIANAIIIIDLICNFIFALTTSLVLKLPSPSYWHFQHDYDVVLGNLLTVNVAVAIAMLIGGTINTYLITKWKAIFNGKYFWLRSISSSCIGEAIMLIIGVTLIFYKTMPLADMIKLIFSDYLFRVIYAIVGAFPASIFVFVLKNNGIKFLYQDSSIQQFNPFKNEKTASSNYLDKSLS